MADVRDVIARLESAASGLRSFYKVGAVELIPAWTMIEAATALRELLAEVERKTAAICAICEARDDENLEALMQAISDAQTEVIVSALETNNG